MMSKRKCLLGIVFGLMLVLPSALIQGAYAGDLSQQAGLLKQLPETQQRQLLEKYRATTSEKQAVESLKKPEVVLPVAQSGMPLTRIEKRRNSTSGHLENKMPSQPRVVEGVLRQFGYDLFTGAPTTFAPVTEIPIPSEYVLGPGDVLEIQLFGKINDKVRLTVDRNGLIDLPRLGPIPVAGLKFDLVRKKLSERVKKELVGEQVHVSLGELRTIRVFVLGDVRRPGSYSVSSLSTITNALFVSGGISPIGSLRDIQLKRRGKLVTRMDLYDLLLQGDTSGDVRLLPGDVIFVPPLGSTISISGEVQRPAIYEIKDSLLVRDALSLAGGLLPTAEREPAQIEKINDAGGRILQDINLADPNDLMLRLDDGALLTVYPVSEKPDNLIVVKGHVRRPGGYPWYEGLRIAELFQGYDTFLPNPDLQYVVVSREQMPTLEPVVFSVDLTKALENPNASDNRKLLPRDEVLVFSRNEAVEGAPFSRRHEVEKLVQKLRRQARSGEPEKVVTIRGHVTSPGNYPLEREMTVEDLIRAAGGLSQEAFSLEAELTRVKTHDGKRTLESSSIPVTGGPEVLLTPYDVLQIRPVPGWRKSETVKVYGEVLFPGEYTIKPDESMQDLLERVGGLTDQAYLPGVVFSRQVLRDKEAKELKRLSDKLRANLATLSLEQAQLDAEGAEVVSEAQGLLREIQSATPVGRLVVDFPAIHAGQERIKLRGGDEIIIPRAPQEVTVLGEVLGGTSHLWQVRLDRDDYIELSGGLTSTADSRRIYVVKANGAVIAGAKNLWFGSEEQPIHPGDTIVVPVDLTRMRPIDLWQTVADITYKLALAAAAANAVGVF